jgi:uncharacterized protein (TIGR03000 family)
MYTMVLMVALSGNADLPACHKKRCHEKAECEAAPACVEAAPCPPAAEPEKPKADPIPEKPKKEEPKMEEKKGARLSTRSTLVVSLPADAKLQVQGVPTTTEGQERTFATPDLNAGDVCAYTLSAEVVIEGKKVTQSRTVNFRAGEVVKVQFDFPASSVAAR